MKTTSIKVIIADHNLMTTVILQSQLLVPGLLSPFAIKSIKNASYTKNMVVIMLVYAIALK